MSVIKGINIGSSTISSNYVDETDSKILVILPEQLYSISAINDVTYTGLSHTPEPEVKAYVDDLEATLTKDVDYELSYSNNINAGVATVTATGIGNFTGTVSRTWNILPAVISFEYINQSYEYNSQYNGIGITGVTTTNNQPSTIKYGYVDGVYNLDVAPQFKDVISKNIYFEITSPNHYTETGSYTLEVTPKLATLIWGETSWMFDGNSHSTTCVVSNLIGSDTCNVVLDGNSITSIGNSIVTAVSLSNSNYKLPETGITKTITITPGMFVKINNVWVAVKEIYKKINGIWVKQDSATGHFLTSSEGGRYLKK